MHRSLLDQVTQLTHATVRTRERVLALLADAGDADILPASALEKQQAVAAAVGEVLDRQLALIAALRSALEAGAPPEPVEERRAALPSSPRRGLVLVPPAPPE